MKETVPQCYRFLEWGDSWALLEVEGSLLWFLPEKEAAG